MVNDNRWTINPDQCVQQAVELVPTVTKHSWRRLAVRVTFKLPIKVEVTAKTKKPGER